MPVGGDEVLLLEKRGGRQEEVRRLGGVGEELVQADHELEPGQGRLDGRRVGHLVHEVGLHEERGGHLDRPHGNERARAHHPQRLDNSLHRTRTQRLIAGESRNKILSGQNSCEQPHRGAAIGAIERLAWRPKPAKAAPGQSRLPRQRRNCDSEPAKCPRGRADILRIENSANDRLTIRQ